MSDPHGCSISKGERWCASLSKCIEEYDQCDPGTGDVGSCTYEWAGLSWDLSPLKRSAHYVIKDVAMQEVYASYTIGICGDVAPGDVDEACGATTGSAYEEMVDGAPAYQAGPRRGDSPPLQHEYALRPENGSALRARSER